MKISTVVGLVCVSLLWIGESSSLAWGGHGGFHGGFHGGHGGFDRGFHHRGVVVVGPGWWGPPYFWGDPYWYGADPYGYYAPPYYPYAPSLTAEQPQVFIEQAPAPAQAQPVWYYCASARAYYPNVENCREPWIEVPPRGG